MRFISKDTLKPFDWFIIIGSILFYIIYWFVAEYKGDSFSYLGAVAGVCGLVCNVLCAKRNILNYLFGLINVTLYAYISWKNSIYGDVVLNAFYYLPMQFIGFYSWMRKRESISGIKGDSEVVVVSKKMNLKQRVILMVSCVVLVIIVGYILKYYTEDPQPFKDSATTVLSIIAMILMVMAYMEQWWLWIFINLLALVMWVLIYRRGGESSAEMVIMWLFYLANSINGYIVWKKAANKSNLRSEEL